MPKTTNIFDIFIKYIIIIGVTLAVSLLGLILAVSTFPLEQRTKYVVPYIILLISAWIPISLYYRPKNFERFYSKISKNKQNKKKIIKIMNSLYDYFEYSNEEILLYNLYYIGENVLFWYNLIFATLIAVFFMILNSPICLNLLKMLNLSDLTANFIKSMLIFILPTFIMYLLTFSFLYYNKSPLIKDNIRILFRKILTDGAFKSGIVLISLMCSLIFIFLFSVILGVKIDYGSIMSTSNVTQYNIVTGANSNQFTLAALYFTLAFTGIVVFSVTGLYLRNKNLIGNRLFEWSNFFQNWYLKNKESINFSVKDYKNQKAVDNFNSQVDELWKLSKSERIDGLKLVTGLYEAVIFIIILIYIIGIFTVLAPLSLLNISFVLFIILSILLAICIFALYAKSSNEEEKTDKSQDNFEDFVEWY